MRVAVLIKQVPHSEGLQLGPDGRLVREGLELEMNAYCRRAVRTGIDLAASTGGRCALFTLGPPSAENVLREGLAAGADDAVLLSDPAFAGSDTLATAQALAAVLRQKGPFDLIVVGRNSVDADTGQVGPAVAELLDLPFVCSVRSLELRGESLHARCEREDGWVNIAVEFPVVVSAAERLCKPVKVPRAEWLSVPVQKIQHLRATDIGAGPWGQAGSPTRVGEARVLDIPRLRRRLDGPIEHQVKDALAILQERGALANTETTAVKVPPQRMRGLLDGPVIGVVLERGRESLARELMGAAIMLARQIDGYVTALSPGEMEATPSRLGAWGADSVELCSGRLGGRSFAHACSDWASENNPWAVLAPSTVWGREIASRMAARLGAGLTGDATGLEVKNGRLVAWKPAFGGQAEVAIMAESQIQMATLRPGVANRVEPRSGVTVAVRRRVMPENGHDVRVLDENRDDDPDKLLAAPIVIGVGLGVSREEYGLLEGLRKHLGAELAATRKVTDQAWLPHSRQVGITGLNIAPRLYIAVGVSGKFNHTVGVRRAGTILAINSDPEAPIFDNVDIGIVGDWHNFVPALVAALKAPMSEQRSAELQS